MSGHDTEILKLWVQQGDAEAFGELVSRYAGLVYAACLRVLRNPADAEDVTQECFLELAQRPPAIRRTLGGWFHRTATHRALNYARAQKRRREREQRYAEGVRRADNAEWDEVAEYIDEAIAALNPGMHQVVVLRYLRGLSQQEVAEALGIAPRTVRHRQQAAVEKIRRHLKKRGVAVQTGLAAMLAAHLAEGAGVPASLRASLGKIAVSGVVPKHSAVALLGMPGGKPAVLTLLGVMVILALTVATQWLSRPEATPEPVTVSTAEAAPAPASPLVEEEANSAVPTTSTPAGPPQITGIVRDPDGKPVVGAIFQDRKDWVVYATTDDTGTFSVAEIPAVESSFWIASGKHRPVAVNSLIKMWQGTTHVEAVLGTFPEEDRILVLDSHGRPVSGAAIVKARSGQEVAISGPEGYAAVSPRAGKVYARHPEFGAGPVVYGSAQLQPPANIEFQVTWQGKPAPAAGIWYSEPLSGKERQLSVSDAGTASLSLPVASQGDRPFAARLDRETEGPLFAVVHVRPVQGETVQVSLELKDLLAGTLHGAMRWDDGSPVIGAKVQVQSPLCPWFRLDAEMGLAGEFEVPLFRGVNVIAEMALGQRWTDPEAASIVVNQERVVLNRDFVLRRVNQADGTETPFVLTVDYGVEPRPGKLMVLTNAWRVDSVQCWIDAPADGTLPLSSPHSLPPGAVIAVDAKHNVAGFWQQPNSAEKLQFAELKLDTPVTALHGKLVDQLGEPVAYGFVDAGRDEGFFGTRTQADSDGAFTLWPVAANSIIGLTAYTPDEVNSVQENVHSSEQVHIVIPRPSQLVFGTVAYEDGTPVLQGMVFLYQNKKEYRAPVHLGAFRLEAQPGPGQIYAQARDSRGYYPLDIEAPAANVELVVPNPEAAVMDLSRQERRNGFLQMGLVFKMYAGEHENGSYPPLSRVQGGFYPEIGSIYPDYLSDSSLLSRLTGQTGTKTAYLGYALDSEEAAHIFLDAYEDLGPEGVKDSDLQVTGGVGSYGGDTIYRLSEDAVSTHFGDSDPDAVSVAQSQTPILIELPGTTGDEEPGGMVLFMDGHVEWWRYPSKYPMTEAFIERLRSLTNP